MPNSDEHRYDDIIDLPHHTSSKRVRMSAIDRAAQFAPFAALVGYGDAIHETARLTSTRVELTDSARAALDEKLRLLAAELDNIPEVTLTYFQPDERKSGGKYVTVSDCLKKIDAVDQSLTLGSGTVISMDSLLDIESPLLPGII